MIHHAVKKWIECYELDPKSATIEILMLLFEVTFEQLMPLDIIFIAYIVNLMKVIVDGQVCGAKYKLEVASFEETNVDDVVVSLVELAKNVFSYDLHEINLC